MTEQKLIYSERDVTDRKKKLSSKSESNNFKILKKI